MFFRGYVETKDKRCVEKFKNRTDFKTFGQVQSLPEYAGVLAEDAVLVDIDDFEMSEILFKAVKEKGLCCRVYKTSRGKHFLFKNSSIDSCKTQCTLAVGLYADIKLGAKNSYEVLKFDGREREIIYDTAENEEAQQIPRWLYPLKSKRKLEFLGMEAGSGRNQSLFNYELVLQSCDFSTEEARETIRIINQYVLKDPLSEQELETILRDEAFKKPVFFSGKTFLFDKFALFLKNNSRIIRINGQLHIYRDGIYIPGRAAIEAAMIQHIPSLSRAKRAEVFEYLNIFIQDGTNARDADWIAFENGVYNICDGTFSEFSPEHIITNKIRWNYNPSAYSKAADEMLENISCGDLQIRLLLEEMTGYCFYRRNELRKAFILAGDGSNGKSTFLAVLQSLLGEENTASLDLKELGDRFKTAELAGKLVNIGDDISDEFIGNSAIFKKLVTGERVSAEQKGRDPFEFNNYSKLVFSANDIPRIKDKSGAVLDRLVIIPFNAKFTVDKTGFKSDIRRSLAGHADVMEYLINLGISGLKRILERQHFTVSEKVQAELDEYRQRNNPILGFIRECEDEDFKIENEPTNKVYKRYQEYCLAGSLQAMSNIEFSKQINRVLNFKVVDKKISGRKYRIFVAD